MDINAELTSVYASRADAVEALLVAKQNDAAALLDSLPLLSEGRSGAAVLWVARIARLVANLERKALWTEAARVERINGALANLLDTLLAEHAPTPPFVRAAEIASGGERVVGIVAKYFEPIAAEE